jgi:serine/threonine protein kinase
VPQRYSPRPPVDDAVSIGTVLEGRYRIVGELGAGGIGRVFRAEHVRLGHHVAVKVLQPRFLEHPQFRPRFEREARALARLAHPHIVAWTDYSIANGFPYLVMEVLSGRPLRVDIAQGPMEEARVRKILKQILGTLAYAHRAGFVHRDLKPGNVFLLDLPGEPDFVKVLDFGFVKLLDAESGRVRTDESQLTVAGVGIGTPSYMSPEQAAGDTTHAVSDLYSLGIMAFELITGKRPFKGDIVAVMRQQMTDPLPEARVQTRVASPELRVFLERATAKRASERFESAEVMLKALDAVPTPWLVDPSATPPAPVMTRRTRVALGVTFFVLLVLALLALGAEATGERRKTSLLQVNALRVREPAPPAPAPTPAVPEALGASPFDEWPRDPLVFAAHRAIMNGRVLTPDVEEALTRFGTEHPDDPRPWLVRAANAVRVHEEERALALYRTAYRVDARARNDPRMLRHLVRIAQDEAHHRPAADALLTIYGSLARAPLEAELMREALPWSSRERLLAARARVLALGAP